jgi:sulfite reductase (NADPH) flavoprotein alpha-component
MATALRQAPLPDPEWRGQLDRLTASLDAAALNWISGYTAALARERSAPGRIEYRPDELALDFGESETGVEPQAQATVLYGSQTGHGRRLAEQLGHAAERAGLSARVLSTLDYNPRELATESVLFVVMSTQGDGDPPDDARAFVDFLNGRRAPKLEKLAYSVLALGDSSYPKYCEAGRLIDERLVALGARRLSARVDCDVDYERPAAAWLTQAVATAGAELGVAATGNSRVRLLTPLSAVSSDPTREHPLEVEVIANQLITGRGSLRAVHHLELALPAGRLDYHPGDALGIVHENPPEVVERVLELSALDGHAPVSFDGRELPLHSWLRSERELTRLTRPFIDAHRARAAAGGASSATAEIPQTWQVADLLKNVPALSRRNEQGTIIGKGYYNTICDKRVDSYETLQACHRRLVEHEVRIQQVVTHGNAFGIYFFDPEGNRNEFYWSTGVDVQQPFRRTIDVEINEGDALQVSQEFITDDQPRYQPVT